MSDNDLAIKMGLIDVHGNILVDDEPKKPYKISSEMSGMSSSETIEISLTPGKYLDTEGRYLRAKLTNNQLNDSEINLEVMHDRYNENDPLALQVFCNQTFIGHIQKYDSDLDIDSWCFIRGKKIIDLTLKWGKDGLLLSRRLGFSEKEQIKQLLLQKVRHEEDAEKARQQQLKVEAEEQLLKAEAEKHLQDSINMQLRAEDTTLIGLISIQESYRVGAEKNLLKSKELQLRAEELKHIPFDKIVPYIPERVEKGELSHLDAAVDTMLQDRSEEEGKTLGSAIKYLWGSLFDK